MYHSSRQVFILRPTVLAMIIVFGGLVLGQEQNLKKLETTAMSNLKAEFGDRVAIKRSRATNKVNFVRVESGSPGGLVIQVAGMAANEKVRSFLKKYGPIFGLQNPEADLTQRVEKDDDLGGSHLVYDQYYNGVPVFGGVLIAHFDNAGNLRSVNGTVVPFIKLDTKPEESREAASATAALAVEAEFLSSSGITVRSTELQIYRSGMAQGVPGENHLVWQVTVGNDRDVRKLVFVDAHSGEIVDQISRTYDALDRRIYDSLGILQIPPSYPSAPFWSEGSAFPTGDPRADEIVTASGETYDFYRKAFGRDSYDGRGGPMISFFNLGQFDNAQQTFLGNQAITLFGDNLIGDDVVGHEWTHAYTAYTDGLVYQWQPGALNEAYSDIFGETVDQLNGRGLDTPGALRETSGDACSVFSMPTDVVRVTSPSVISGDYDAALDKFAEGSPVITTAGISGQVVQVDDGVGISSDGCSSPFVNAADVNGKIAMMDATAESPDGICFATTKVLNAQANGAIGVILANDSSVGDQPVNFGCHCVLTSIPSVDVGQNTGDKIRAQLAAGPVSVFIFSNAAKNRDNSYRWLLGEDTYIGDIRDMWNPGCHFHPGRVTDRRYSCSTFDNGGVHENSGIPNHTFALLVDGGNYNGQSVSGIGLIKAAHIYFRAMSVYQVPFTDFADHAEALEAAAQDLVGRNLADLKTGLPSGERIGPNDLRQLHAATLATELRDTPAQCNFQPLLGKNPPEDSCNLPATKQSTIFSDSFEGNPSVRWTATREVADPTTFQGGNWSWVHDLPDGRRGSGFFAYDFPGGCGLPDPSQNGVLELASPAINIPVGLAGGPHLSFDHWVALEQGFDGGQLMISVNGGPFQLVDPTAFIYNGYNASFLPFPYSDNVRGGQPAFTGTDAGSPKGSWGTSIVDLSGYAHSGDTIRLRFDMSTDFCFGSGLGWYLDNVRVYACDVNGL